MAFIHWILNNFGLFFGAVFLGYIFLMVRRLTDLYDYLRLVPGKRERETSLKVGENKALDFLADYFRRLKMTVTSGTRSSDALIDAIWSEVDCRIGVHFTALNGYANTLILIGFAGTIFGSIGAFNEMFRGLAKGEASAMVFVTSWNNGLATALYTSLGAAAIGGTLLTLLCSRFFMTRAKQLETMVGLRISEIMEEENPWPADPEESESPLKEHRIPEKTCLPISSC
jgi:hypothetical protein